jgi:hypothetical protein
MFSALTTLAAFLALVLLPVLVPAFFAVVHVIASKS